MPSTPDQRAERIKAVFARGLPDGTAATPTEVARRAQAAGHRISRPYVGQLRSGSATNPAFDTIVALAEVFQVDPSAFFPSRSPSSLSEHQQPQEGSRPNQ